MNLGRKVTENQGKMKNMRFLLKFILSLQKSVVTLHRFNGEHGRLAQLVQSICLTSRGSGVRIPQRPLKPPFSEAFSSPAEIQIPDYGEE